MIKLSYLDGDDNNDGDAEVDVSARLWFFSTAETVPPDGSEELLTVFLGLVGGILDRSHLMGRSR